MCKKKTFTNVQASGKSYFERVKRVKFLSLNEFLIMIIEKGKKYGLIMNIIIQRNVIMSDWESYYERARRVKFLSMNEFSLMVRENCKKIPLDLKKEMQHNVITSDWKKLWRTNERSEMSFDQKTFFSISKGQIKLKKKNTIRLIINK